MEDLRYATIALVHFLDFRLKTLLCERQYIVENPERFYRYIIENNLVILPFNDIKWWENLYLHKNAPHPTSRNYSFSDGLLALAPVKLSLRVIPAEHVGLRPTPVFDTNFVFALVAADVKYEYFNPNAKSDYDLDPAYPTEAVTSWTFGLNYFINDWSRVQVNYILNDDPNDTHSLIVDRNDAYFGQQFVIQFQAVLQ